MTIDDTLVVKIVILMAFFSLVYTTLKSVVKGAKEGLQNGKDIFNGVPFEKIKQREREKELERERKQQKKMESKLYRVTHPLEYINSIVTKKIRERAQ